MGKAVKHSAKLRRKSSGTIFQKRVFRGNQKTPVPKACSSQPQLINITNRDRDGSRTAATSNIEHFVIIVIYNDYRSSFEYLLDRDKGVTIHLKNVRTLAIEMFKVSPHN